MQMRDINNLLDNLKGNERDVAAYIVLKIKHSRWHEHVFTIDEIIKNLYVNKDTVSRAIVKLIISEIIREQKIKHGQYKFMPYNRESFEKVVQVFRDEVVAND